MNVLSESKTLRRIAEGRLSCSRFGDGEMAIAACRKGARGQEYVPSLSARLCEVARSRDPNLLVCIPRIFKGIPEPKRAAWERWLRPERTSIYDPTITYGSAFISRPDFFGKPFGAAYWSLMRGLWQDRPMLLVRGDTKKPELFDNAASIEVLMGPPQDAWRDAEALLAACMIWASRRDSKGGLVVLQLGPAATCLAASLAGGGVQALDLGKASRFYRDEMRG